MNSFNRPNTLLKLELTPLGTVRRYSVTGQVVIHYDERSETGTRYTAGTAVRSAMISTVWPVAREGLARLGNAVETITTTDERIKHDGDGENRLLSGRGGSVSRTTRTSVRTALQYSDLPRCVCVFAGGVTLRTARRQRQFSASRYDPEAATSTQAHRRAAPDRYYVRSYYYYYICLIFSACAGVGVCPERNGRYPLGNQCDK